jgi:hypothetical protein
MATNNPYYSLVDRFARLLNEGEAISPVGLISPDRPGIEADMPRALIFSPHPDDEIIIGALPLRLLREQKLNVINVAVTLGSLVGRQAERWQELKKLLRLHKFRSGSDPRKGPGGHQPDRTGRAAEAVLVDAW